MKAALVALAVVAAIALPEVLGGRIRSTTHEPCPDICPLIYQPTCAKDVVEGKYYWFANRCLMESCKCRTDLDLMLVPIEDCPDNASRKCPIPVDGSSQSSDKSERSPKSLGQSAEQEDAKSSPF